jgi:predicted transcriptional regulator
MVLTAYSALAAAGPQSLRAVCRGSSNLRELGRSGRAGHGTPIDCLLLEEATMLKVGDVMTREVFTLNDDASVEDAAWALMSRHIGGAPVRDREGHVVGVVSQTDLVNPDRVADPVTVDDVMTPALLALREDAPAIDAARFMLMEQVHRLVVLGTDGKVTGIVTPMDLLQALVDGRFRGEA